MSRTCYNQMSPKTSSVQCWNSCDMFCISTVECTEKLCIIFFLMWMNKIFRRWEHKIVKHLKFNWPTMVLQCFWLYEPICNFIQHWRIYWIPIIYYLMATPVLLWRPNSIQTSNWGGWPRVGTLIQFLDLKLGHWSKFLK